MVLLLVAVALVTAWRQPADPIPGGTGEGETVAPNVAARSRVERSEPLASPYVRAPANLETEPDDRARVSVTATRELAGRVVGNGGAPVGIPMRVFVWPRHASPSGEDLHAATAGKLVRFVDTDVDGQFRIEVSVHDDLVCMAGRQGWISDRPQPIDRPEVVIEVAPCVAAVIEYRVQGGPPRRCQLGYTESHEAPEWLDSIEPGSTRAWIAGVDEVAEAYRCSDWRRAIHAFRYTGETATPPLFEIHAESPCYEPVKTGLELRRLDGALHHVIVELTPRFRSFGSAELHIRTDLVGAPEIEFGDAARVLFEPTSTEIGRDLSMGWHIASLNRQVLRYDDIPPGIYDVTLSTRSWQIARRIEIRPDDVTTDAFDLGNYGAIRVEGIPPPHDTSKGRFKGVCAVNSRTGERIYDEFYGRPVVLYGVPHGSYELVAFDSMNTRLDGWAASTVVVEPGRLSIGRFHISR